MIIEFKEVFKEINNCCFEIKEKHSFIFEDEKIKKGVFVNAKDDYHLHIEKDSNKALYFIQNDNCIMKNYKGGQCDYLIFNDFELFFCEIKVAKSNFPKYKKEAYQQIESTYKFYKDKLDFKNIILNAQVVFPNKSRIIKTSESTKKKEFEVKYQLKLKIGNYIKFE